MAAEDKIIFDEEKITEGNTGPSANATISPGSSMVVPFITFDKYGNIVQIANRSMTLNSSILDSSDIVTSFSSPVNTKVPGAKLVYDQLATKEPIQKRGQWNSGDSTYYTKCGYTCFLHASNETASSVVKTLPSAYRPKYAVTVSGWCFNNNTNGYYPCIGSINNDGTWRYLTAMDTLGMSSEYYIYNSGTNRLSRFNVWLTGAWATNTNGA